MKNTAEQILDQLALSENKMARDAAARIKIVHAAAKDLAENVIPALKDNPCAISEWKERWSAAMPEAQNKSRNEAFSKFPSGGIVVHGAWVDDSEVIEGGEFFHKPIMDTKNDWAIGFTFVDQKNIRLGCAKEVLYKCAPYSQDEGGSNPTYFIFGNQFENEFSLNEFMRVYNEADVIITYGAKTGVSMNRSVFHGDVQHMIKSRSMINAFAHNRHGFLLSIEI